jgi:hypothetical protein
MRCRCQVILSKRQHRHTGQPLPPALDLLQLAQIGAAAPANARAA